MGFIPRLICILSLANMVELSLTTSGYDPFGSMFGMVATTVVTTELSDITTTPEQTTSQITTLADATTVQLPT